ncbi:MAG: hypothetical protein NW220_13250 [Leptolyngbyaceae cyanobacterium bins.349]|nr:hypothetical protein [Leptolyngbyaceae cyanobacterium bins.349]
MSLTPNLLHTQTQIASTSSANLPAAQQLPTLTSQPPTANATRVTVEMPTNSTLPFNPFDPGWVKLWEQVGPTSYLALLCVFIWLLTRFVETVKSK